MLCVDAQCIGRIVFKAPFLGLGHAIQDDNDSSYGVMPW